MKVSEDIKQMLENPDMEIRARVIAFGKLSRESECEQIETKPVQLIEFDFCRNLNSLIICCFV